MSDKGDATPPVSPRDSAGLSLEAIDAIIAEDPVHVEINSLRIFSLEEIYPCLAKLTTTTQSLGFRKNLVHEILPLPLNLRHIVELDLYDNKVKVVRNLETLPHLRKLDLSYNQIRDVQGLDTLSSLEELYLVENKIKVIQGLGQLTNLKLLELGGNSIREIGAEAFVGLANLEQLFLGKNKIQKIQGLEALTKLQRLSLQANRLICVADGLRNNTSLTELYLSENGIPTIEGVAHLQALKLLDYSMNPVVSLAGIEPLQPCLTEFWLTDGKVADWGELARLQSFNVLRTIYLERNPIESDKRYRNKVYHALPQLVQIDSWPIVNKSNPEADRSRDYRAGGSDDKETA